MLKLVKELLAATNSRVKRLLNKSIWWSTKNRRLVSLIRFKSSTRSSVMPGSTKTYTVLIMAPGLLVTILNSMITTNSEIRPFSLTKVAGLLTSLGLQTTRHTPLVPLRSPLATLFGLNLQIKSIWTQPQRCSSSRSTHSASVNSITRMIFPHLVTSKHSQMRPPSPLHWTPKVSAYLTICSWNYQPCWTTLPKLIA